MPLCLTASAPHPGCAHLLPGSEKVYSRLPRPLGGEGRGEGVFVLANVERPVWRAAITARAFRTM